MNILTKLVSIAFLALILTSISCGDHIYTKADLAGDYWGYALVRPHNYSEYLVRDSLGKLCYYRGYSNPYFDGDSANDPFTYYVFHRLLMPNLHLYADGSFKCSDTPHTFKCGGIWEIEANDIVLYFDSLPRDSMYVAGYFIEKGLLPHQGKRQIKIIKKNRLFFECPRYNAPENYVEITTYER